MSKVKDTEQVVVWQYLVRHPRSGYRVTNGYFTSDERCAEVLKTEYTVVRKIESTRTVIDERDVKRFEML